MYTSYVYVGVVGNDKQTSSKSKLLGKIKMRKVIDVQMQLGEIQISRINIDIKSRDEIPKVLLGLQHVYCNLVTREEVFSVLERIIPDGTSMKTGRPGMDLWRVLVLGTVRLSCNWDFDKLREIANNHRTLRQMLRHGLREKNYSYSLQTLKDNLSLFEQEHLDEINQVVVKAGHKALGMKGKWELRCQCDSFVGETDVHFPTDINLLLDAIFKVIILITRESKAAGVLGWGKSVSNLLKIKSHYRYLQKLKKSTSKNEEKKQAREDLILKTYQEYIEMVQLYLRRASETMVELLGKGESNIVRLLEIERFMLDGNKLIDQIERRVFKGETIPHAEKVFSLFERHTEWICKGKAGVRQELGVRISVLKDQHGFILYHHVMENQTDDKVAVLMVEEAKRRFPGLTSCSFDKGYYSPSNKEKLSTLVPEVYLPKKGKLSQSEKEVEGSEDFVLARRKHSSVESSINGLEHCGLDRCLDHGIKGFKRYAALSVLARNIQTLGNIIQAKQLKSLKRKEKQRQAA